ncbi:hypothetical protein ACJMK2_044314 [Sinanodonta woodiana]|uniref:Death domain-containing protein n=1 Tax=Sinanodonta woodiana TaxID=1069815 RepID=A0ABD3VZN0_SINWO
MLDAKERANQLFTFIESDDTEKAAAILEEDVDFSVIKNGYHLIELAARCGMKVVVEKLIKKGMSASLINESGHSALHYAAREGHAEIVEHLIKNGANANVENKKGETPLHMAVMHTKQGAMEALLMNGADLYLKDKSGKTPEDYAKDSDLARLIRKYSELGVAFPKECKYIVADEIQISPKTAEMPLLMVRAEVTILNLETKAVLPVLLYCRRENPGNSSAIVLQKGDEIVSDIFLIKVNNCEHNVKLQIKVPLKVKISKKEELIVKFLNDVKGQFQKMEEHSGITYCHLQLDANPGSKKELVVLSRHKREEYTVGANGSSIHSKLDENFIVDIPPGTFKKDTKLAMKVYETRQCQQLAEEGTKMTGTISAKQISANPVLVTDIFLISIEGKQPTKNVTIQIPSYEKIVKSDDMVIVAGDEKHLMDEKCLEIIPVKPKHENGNITFEVERFNLFVAAQNKPEHLKDVAELISASIGRKRPCVFFCMMKMVTSDKYLAIVECSAPNKSPERREFWRGNGFIEQHMIESETVMIESSQGLQVIFSENINVTDDTKQKRLFILRNNFSYQLYHICLKEKNMSLGGEIDIVKIVQDGKDSSNTDRHVTCLAVILEYIQQGSSTVSINNESLFMILKPESLKVLGQALTRKQGTQLGTQLGLDEKTMNRIRLHCHKDVGYANYKIIEMWLNMETNWWRNVSETTESTIINALIAIDMQKLADALMRVKGKKRALFESDLSNL